MSKEEKLSKAEASHIIDQCMEAWHKLEQIEITMENSEFEGLILIAKASIQKITTVITPRQEPNTEDE